MIKYLEPIDQLPAKIKLPLIRAFELFKEEVAETVKRSDFERFERATEEISKRYGSPYRSLPRHRGGQSRGLSNLRRQQKRILRGYGSL